MPRRRELLRAVPLTLAASACQTTGSRDEGFADLPRSAHDEEGWRRLSAQFAADRTINYLNNGGVAVPLRRGQEVLFRETRAADGAPSQILWSDQERAKAPLRERLARALDCEADAVSLVRNTSEGLELLQQGIDLEAGDEVVHADQDYPRMRATWRQRARREGIVLRTVRLPGPTSSDEEIVAAYAELLGPRTKVVFVSQVVNLTGRLLPVRALTDLARQAGALCIVDGAHGFGHLPTSLRDLGVDLYASSLHKGLSGPTGTGVLVVRGEALRRRIWPLFPAEESLDGQSARYEQIGTHPIAPFLALEPALSLFEALGPELRAARLRVLRDRWLDPLLATGRAQLQAPRDRTCGLATLRLDGLTPREVHAHLWGKHRIRTSPIQTDAVAGTRISPGLHTRPEDLAHLCSALEELLRS